ncbi:MAG: coproporphyrinogen dehydrogenase HemZ, partial [Selenomonadaceae bacterium]|nr:coproporphyrinogen dehydrogenase HemZ [Selenomonadaceae bacterium]
MLKIKSICVHSDREVIHKLTHELLDLFHIEVGEGEGDFEVFLEIREKEPVFVKTRLKIDNEEFSKEGEGFLNERNSGAVHRLYKKHLYEMLREKFGFPKAEWGILHGVRPTKIVRRYFEDGLTEGEIFSRLTEDYLVSEEKARLLLEVSEREKCILEDRDEKKISVYIGIPFCLSRCFYCSFPSYLLPGEKKLAEFAEVFKRDLLAAKDEIKRHNFKIECIYMGGGTPTSLPNELFAKIMGLVEDAFVTEDLKEFTLEAGRPDSMSEDKYNIIFNSPVTRVSVNPQTMNEKTLIRIGRKHSPEDIKEMFCAFRKKTDLDINMDLILGLPGETATDVEATVKEVIAIEPDDITLHALAKKRGSPLKLALDEKEEVILPSDDETRKMSKIANRLIREANYAPYYLYRQGYMSGGLENIGFAKPNKESVY